MFSSIIRLGIAISGAAILSSCGGNSTSIAETQISTPEGLYTGLNTVTLVNPNTAATITQSQNMLVFVVANGAYYMFFSAPATPSVVTGAQAGTLSFSGGTMVGGGIVEVTLPTVTTVPGVPTSFGAVSSPSFTGGYNTGINFAGTLTYPAPDANGNFQTTTFNLNYNTGYQGIQNLATLAGTYTGTVGTSAAQELATFTFSPASVPANSGNQFGVAIITGQGADGCSYTGIVAPLFKGNGYTTNITSGGAPCLLPNNQFSGLIYLDTTNNLLYSYAPDTARTDGLIFFGSKL